MLWAWWPIQLGGRSSAQGKPAIKLTPEVQFGMNHAAHFSFQLVFCVSINKGGNKSNVQKKNSRKNFVPIAMTAPSFKSPWTQPDHVAATGCKSNAQGWQSVYWKGSGTTFHWRLRAADGPCRARISAFSCDLAEDALVARVSCIGEGHFVICPSCEP